MPSLEYFLVADSFSVDQTTNRLSIFHVLEEIHAPEFPIVIARLVAVAHWNAEEGDADRDFQIGFIIKSPDGERPEFTQNFRMIRPRHRTIAHFMGLPVPGPGVMTIEIRLNGKHEAVHTIDIRKIEA